MRLAAGTDDPVAVKSHLLRPDDKRLAQFVQRVPTDRSDQIRLVLGGGQIFLGALTNPGVWIAYGSLGCLRAL